MKIKDLMFVFLFGVLWGEAVEAVDFDRCGWRTLAGNISGYDVRFWSITVPSSIFLRKAEVGSVMASTPIIDVHYETWQIICPLAVAPMLRNVTIVEQVELVEGYTDVYKTGLAGIGMRIESVGFYKARVPFVWEYANSISQTTSIINKVRVDFVRTSRDVAAGEVRVNFRINEYVNGWKAAEVNIGGVTKFDSPNYFGGCVGLEKLDISLGRFFRSEVGSDRRRFNLDVLCSGMSAGTKVPVKVYFDGSSDGPGRLNLEPGGAKGVEISLLSDKGVGLPFSQSSALAMTWMRSEPNGEVYRLPVVAGYARKVSQKIEAGKANATLNYVLEYN